MNAILTRCKEPHTDDANHTAGLQDECQSGGPSETTTSGPTDDRVNQQSTDEDEQKIRSLCHEIDQICVRRAARSITEEAVE